MKKIKVSIIVPVYNVEKYIEQCLKSIISQTLKEIEIIIVNDGTKDKSMEIVKTYLNDERIKVINKENGGISSARNAGLKNAKGKYIAFIDSDDFIEKSMFEDLFLEAEKNDSEIVYSNVMMYNDNTKKLEKRVNKKNVEIKDKIGTYYYKYCYMEVWNKIYKRSFLLENNITFEEGIIHEDNLFTLKCFFLAKNIKYLNKYHYIYRKDRKNSILNSKNQKKEKNSFEIILKKIIEFEREYKGTNIFSKIRLLLAELEHQTLLYRVNYDKKYIISKEQINNLQFLIKKEWIKFTELERYILKNDFIDLIESRAFENIDLLDLFYWKNGMMTKKGLRRILIAKGKRLI